MRIGELCRLVTRLCSAGCASIVFANQPGKRRTLVERVDEAGSKTTYDGGQWVGGYLATGYFTLMSSATGFAVQWSRGVVPVESTLCSHEGS